MSNVGQLITTAEAAERLKIPRRKVARLVQRGVLQPAAKGPGRKGPFLFDVAAVERLRVDGIPDRRYRKWKEAT